MTLKDSVVVLHTKPSVAALPPGLHAVVCRTTHTGVSK